MHANVENNIELTINSDAAIVFSPLFLLDRSSNSLNTFGTRPPRLDTQQQIFQICKFEKCDYNLGNCVCNECFNLFNLSSLGKKRKSKKSIFKFTQRHSINLQT